MNMQLNAIGQIHSQNGLFTLQVDEPYRSGLLEVNQFDTLLVLYWCHYLDTPQYRNMLVVDKAYKNAPQKLGVFATRSPARPNPIAVTSVSLLSVDMEKGIITVPYIDAEEGSPLLDIKPYTPSIDRVRDTQPPAWAAYWPACYEESGTFDWSSVFENAR
jgi:tRNA (adenine37-N6)-methyltransferase